MNSQRLTLEAKIAGCTNKINRRYGNKNAVFGVYFITHQREDKNLVHGKTASSSSVKAFEVWRSLLSSGHSADWLSLRPGWQTSMSMSWRFS